MSLTTVSMGGGNIANEYTPVEYIQGNGNSYIDTQVVPTMNTGAYMRTSLTSRRSGDNIVLGATNTNAFASGNPFSIDIYTDSVWFPHGGTGSAYERNKVMLTTNLDTIYDCKVNYLNSGKASVDGNEITLGSSTAMTTKSLHIFNLNTNAGGSSQYATTGAKLYKLILTEGNAITHEYIPVRRNSDNKCGLYDLNTNAFYTSATSTANTCP